MLKVDKTLNQEIKLLDRKLFVLKKELEEWDLEREKEKNINMEDNPKELTSQQKGKLFEKYVKDIMFPDKFYTIVSETPPFDDVSERFNESAIKPDFCFKRRKNGNLYNIEAKFRSIDKLKYKYYIQICTEKQLVEYKNANDEIPTFIALGVGREPSNPDLLMLIDIAKIDKCEFSLPEILNNFYFYKGMRVLDGYLQSLIKKR